MKDKFQTVNKALAAHAGASGYAPSIPKAPSPPKPPKVPSSANLSYSQRFQDHQHSSQADFERRKRNQLRPPNRVLYGIYKPQ